MSGEIRKIMNELNNWRTKTSAARSALATFKLASRGQEQVADAEPPSVAFPSLRVEEEFKNMASYESSKPADTRAVVPTGMESKSDTK